MSSLSGLSFGVLKRAVAMFRRHGMTDWGASMTYFLVMSLFPALLVAVSLLGLFGQQGLVTESVRYLEDAGAPEETLAAVERSLQELVDTSGARVGFGLVFGLLWTAIVIVLGVIALGSVLLGGTVAEDLFGTIGLGSTAATIWTYARWLVALVAMMVVFAIIYAYAPDVEQRRFQWISPGAALGVLIWIVASALFFVYVSNFADYGATYGAFAGAVLLLLWLYITSLAFLLGGEVNGEIERAQLAGRGGPPPLTPPPSARRPVPVPVAPSGARDTDDVTERGPGG